MAKAYQFNFKRLDVYQAAVEHFRWIVQVMGRIPRAPFAVNEAEYNLREANLARIASMLARLMQKQSKPGT